MNRRGGQRVGDEKAMGREHERETEIERRLVANPCDAQKIYLK
jgi:hypothetical protein